MKSHESSVSAVGQELLSIKRELCTLCQVMSTVCASTIHQAVSPDVAAPQEPVFANQTPLNQLVVTSWNCRGYKNALPYINHLIQSGSDIIALLSEHWMWPFELCQIHPDYAGYGKADKRLHAQSNLSRGCGGVGLMWRNSIHASPVNIDSDRVCGIQIELKDCHLFVLSVYLSCSGQSFEEFSEYVKDLQCIVSTLQTQGPVIVAGDFNAHLPVCCSMPNEEGHLIAEFIDQNHLYPVSCSSISSGPNYTFFTDTSKSIVDYYHDQHTSCS